MSHNVLYATLTQELLRDNIIYRFCSRRTTVLVATPLKTEGTPCFDACATADSEPVSH